MKNGSQWRQHEDGVGRPGKEFQEGGQIQGNFKMTQIKG